MHQRTLRTRLRRTAILAVAMFALAQPGFAKGPDLQGTLNLNEANVEQLVLLPGVGESRAQAIVKLRKRLGSFNNVAQLVEVKGIGPAALAKLKPFVRTSGKTNLRLD